MIPAITEVNFPSYATLHQATVSLQEMGDRTISTQVRINGNVVPDFTGWELQFKGERFVLPTRTPQAQKDNTTKNALVDLQFQSWAIEQLKHYFFVSLSEYETGKYIPDQYNASVILPLEGFVQLFNKVLQYYFGTSIRMDLYGAGTGLYSTTPVTVEINKTYIWDVLIKFYELFGVRWYIAYEQGTGVYVIKVGYTADAITDHDFEYGYKGGLLKFERHVQDEDVRNILLGRGGEKNLPYRYFKLQDPNNTAWEADPDAIPELANIYFDRLRDINFRWYVRGWMQNSHRDTSWDETHTFPQYTENDCPESHLFAFRKGKTDAKFDPVEYVKDDDSIEKYGERWGAVDDNDEVYPTIQGMTATGLGRVDQCVDVSDIITDDIQAAAAAAATTSPIGGTKTITKTVPAEESVTDELLSEPFTIPVGQTGNVQYSWMTPKRSKGGEFYPDTIVLDTSVENLVAVDESTGTEYPISGLAAGTYRIKITLTASNSSEYDHQATYGLDTLEIVLSSVDENAWKPTFDIWVKNIWETTQGQGETDEQYATRVWEKILGDRVGNEAKIVFSDGFMSISQDYEFVIAAYPVKDRSKTITVAEDGETHTYTSEWRITLYKSDAEFEATGLYIPNSTTGGKPAAGDHFFFIGIDMPFLYVTKAEERLNGADLTPVINKTKALGDLADVQPTWVITLDKVRVNTLEDGEYGQTLAERLSAGATVRIKDPRFTPGEVLTLYVKSITYTWNEPTSGNPYLVPDIEVVLSDKVASVEGTVTRVANELNVVKATYAKSSDVEAAVRSVGGALFLKKTGEADSSNSPTAFASKVSSKNFRQGDIGGAGWGLYTEEGEDSGSGSAVLEVDKLVVRKEMRVNELVANQIAYVGGKQIISAAAINCTQVVETNDSYVCYFDQKQGTVANLFAVGDVAMGQVFDEENTEVSYYRCRVTGVGVDYITLSKSVKDGSGAPAVGDTIVQYGSYTNANRRFVIVRDVIGGGYERMIRGLDSVTANGSEYHFSGYLPGTGPRWFVGDSAGEYAEWVNGRLNIKGTLIIRNSDGSYQSMTDYMAAVQAQIDGQVMSWASGQAPSQQTVPYPQVDPETGQITGTPNFPASSWTSNTEREKHFGDIYADDSTGQLYRYTKRLNNGVTEYYWTRVSDEEVAALATQVAGLQYLKQALPGSTLVQGGLVLTSLIQLGQVENNVFRVYSGINGLLDQTLADPAESIAAWFGGPMVDHEKSPSAAQYALSLFRHDGSGYLAGGNIHWNETGQGGIPGITWGGNSVVIGGSVKLESTSGDSVTELINLVRQVTNMFIDETYTEGGQTKHRIKVNPAVYEGLYTDGFLSAGGLNPDSGGGGGGVDLLRVWQSLTNNTSLSEVTDNTQIALAHIPYTGVVSQSDTTHLVTAAAVWSAINAKPSGTVTSVGISVPTGLQVSNSPVTSSGTIAITLASGYSIPLTADTEKGVTAYNGLGIISGALQSLQSQIDSLASRDFFDNLAASFISADTIAAPVVYGDLAGNAASASKLATSGPFSIWGVQFWSNGVPNSVTGRPGLYIGTTQVQVSSVAQALGGITTLSASGLATVGSFKLTSGPTLTWDSDNNAWHLSGNFYADGWISAGGSNSGGGGGEGVDLLRVWQSLTNDQTLESVTDTTKIALAHIPTIPTSNISGLGSLATLSAITTSYITDLESWISRKGYVTSSGVTQITTGTGLTGGPITATGSISISDAYLTKIDHGETAYNGLSTISAVLQSLQSQIDSVASRTGFDELVVSSLFAGAFSASSAVIKSLTVIDTISGKSSDSEKLNGQAASYYATADSLSTLQGYFDANGNAKSALKLTTTSKSIWGVTYWTDGGVPQDVTAAPNLYIGGTKVQTSAAAQILKGVTAISNAVSPGSTDETYIEWDATNHAWHFHGGLYADTFISAGGVGSGGGSSIDLDRVWESLTNNTDKPNVKINVAHIPSLDWSIITSGKPNSLSGYGILDAYTKTQVDNLIGAINQFHYEIAASTSAVTDPKSNVLYLIGPTGSGSDKYEEYVYTTQWVKIGDTSIDLAPYLLASVAAQTYVPLTRTVNGHALSADVTVTKGDVGLGNVDNLAASSYFTEFTNGTSSDANKVIITVGGTQKKLTIDYAANADALDGHDSTYFGTASDVTTLQGYFTNGVANSALRLSGTSAYSIWGVEYWANGVPKSVTGRPNLYIGTTQVQASSAAQALAGITTIAASGLATIQGGLSLGGQYNNADSKLVWDDDAKAWHLIGNLYADGFISAGGLNDGGSGGGVDLPRVWQSLSNSAATFTPGDNSKIATAHLPSLSGTGVSAQYSSTGSGATLATVLNISLVASGVTAGTYTKVTVDQYGRATAGTTLDASDIPTLAISKISGLQTALDNKQPLDADLTAIAGLSGTSGFLKKTAANTWTLDTNTYLTGITAALVNAAYGFTITGTAGASYSLADLETNSHTHSNKTTLDGITSADVTNWGTAYSALDTISAALQSLQSQIDSIASINSRDEVTASVVSSDVVSATSGYIASLFGELYGNAATATKLATARTLWGQSFDGTGNVSGSLSSVTDISMTGSISGTTTIMASGLIKTTNYVQATRLYLSNDVYFVLDSNGVKLEGAGFYTDSFITAGGYNSGGGGGVDMLRVWQELTNDSSLTTYDSNTKIALAHIPTIPTTKISGLGSLASLSSITTSYITDLESWISGKGYVTSSGVTSVGLSVPTGFSVTNAPVTSTGTIAISFASGYSLPTTSKQSEWDAKQDAISDLDTIRSNASNAYGWGNHATAGYLLASTAATTYQTIISDLSTIRSNASNGNTAYEGLTTVSVVLQSLQSQIDSVATRDCFDEITAAAVFADTLSSASATIKTLTVIDTIIGKATDSDKLGGQLPSYYATASDVTTLQGYFTNGVANSAAKLTTVSKTAWGQTYWTSGGVPDSISGDMSSVGDVTPISDSTKSLGSSSLMWASLHTKKVYLASGVYLEYDSVNSGVKLVGAGFYTDSYVTAGGINSEGGGSVDLDRVWESLTNNTDKPNVLINVAHIPSIQNMSGFSSYVYSAAESRTANTVLAAPNGSNGVATFRSLVAADIPTLAISKIDGLQTALNGKQSAYAFTISGTSGTTYNLDSFVSSSGVTSITAGTGLSGGTITGSGTIAIDSTYQTYISNGNTAYGWGNHANAGYLLASTASSTYQPIITDLATIRSNASNGNTAYDSLTTVSSVLKALQAQVDSVASRNAFDEIVASTIFSDIVSGNNAHFNNIYGALTGNASSATVASYLVSTSHGVGSATNPIYFTGGRPAACSYTFGNGSGNAPISNGTMNTNLYAQYAALDSAYENIADKFGIVSSVLQSMQSQIDSVTTRSYFDELTAACGYFDILSVGADANIKGNTGILGLLSVSGAATLSSTLSVTGNVTFGANATVTGKLYFASTHYMEYVSGNSGIHTNTGFYSDSYITSGAASASSDARLKENISIVTAEKAMSILAGLSGKEWDWNERKTCLAGKHGSGLVAQDVMKVMPWAVLDLNGELSLNYNCLWGVAIPAIKSHEERIKELENKVKELEEKLNIQS